MAKRKTSPPLLIEQEEFPFLLFRSSRKSLRMVLRPGGELLVHAPRRLPLGEVREFVNSKRDWLVVKQAELDARQVLPYPERFETGEIISHLGELLTLLVVAGRGAAEAVGEQLVVRVARPGQGQAAAKAVDRWQRAQALDVFGRVVAEFLPLAGCPAHKRPSLTVRQMKSRWGSCAAAGRITLNLQLVQCPPPCVEYVIMHELAHLVHHDHSKRFYAHLSRLMPDWQKRKEILDSIMIRRRRAAGGAGEPPVA